MPGLESNVVEPPADLIRTSAKAPRSASLTPDTEPELSPSTPATWFSSMLAEERDGAAPSRQDLLLSLQRGFGNDYVQQVLKPARPERPVRPASALDRLPTPAPVTATPAVSPKGPNLTAQARATPAATPTIPAPKPDVAPVTPPPRPVAAPAPTSGSVLLASSPSVGPGAAPPAATLAAPAPPPVRAAATPAAPEAEATPEGAEAAAREPAAAGSSAAASAEATAAPAASETASPTVEGPAPEMPAQGTSAAEAGETTPAPREGSAPETAGPPAEARAPASPGQDPAFQAVIGRAKRVAYKQGHNTPAQRKAAEAQAAAKGPANEVQGQAEAAQVDKMSQQEPAPFDKAGFKSALLAKIASITPKNLEEADEFKKKNKAGSIKGDVVAQVDSSKENAQGPIQKTTEEPPDPSAAHPKEVVSQPPTEAGPAPAGIGGDQAAPKPKTDAEVSLEAGSQSLDQKLEENEVTEEQLQDSNEPEFQGAVAKKGEAQADAKEAPAAYRQDESAVVAGAQANAAANASKDVASMHDVRDVQFSTIAGQQDQTQTEDQRARAEVSAHVTQIYKDTKDRVDARLKALDEEVNRIFDSGAEQARTQFENYVDQRMSAYKYERYTSPAGLLLWGKDKLLGLPDEVNAFYQEGKELYLRLMDAVIDQVAAAVETGLNEAAALIAQGRQQVQDYVLSLPADLQEVGQKAANDIQKDFDKLKDSVDAKQNQLIDSLAQKYVDNLKAIDARINEMKASNRGLVDDALDAIEGVLKTIIELKNMLLGVLARAAEVIGKIIKHPIDFLANLVAAVGMGLRNFMSNIGTHLQKGLMGWLFGAVAEAGIKMPESFDLKGILDLVLQVLGLTYANIRSRAVRILGEPLVSRLEQVAEIFKVLVTEGPAGLWEYIKDKIGDLKTMVIEGIKSFVIEKIIIAGITWIISLLNPASAFIKACKAIIDIVTFIFTRGAQILAFVNAVLDSVAAIAAGAIAGAAAAVENALGKAIPIAIGFLASLLGLGGISEKIKSIIAKIQAPVNTAIDWVINKAVSLVKAAGNLLTGGGKKEEKETPETNDPEHDAKVAAGTAAIDTEEQKYLEDGKISRENAEKVAATVKQQHSIFKTLVVIDAGERWDFDYTASPGKTKAGKKKNQADGVLVVSLCEAHPRSRSSVRTLDVEESQHPGTFERNVTQAVEAATGRTAQTGVRPYLSGQGNIGNLPREETLLTQPIITYPQERSVGARATRAPKLGRQPDVILLRSGRDAGQGQQVEVFEATLDARFLLGRGEGVPGSSHKRTQLAGTIAILLERFPGVPIIYNVVTQGDPPPQVRHELELQLKQLRRQYSAADIQIIWRG